MLQFRLESGILALETGDLLGLGISGFTPFFRPQFASIQTFSAKPFECVNGLRGISRRQLILYYGMERSMDAYIREFYSLAFVEFLDQEDTLILI